MITASNSNFNRRVTDLGLRPFREKGLVSTDGSHLEQASFRRDNEISIRAEEIKLSAMILNFPFLKFHPETRINYHLYRALVLQAIR